MALKLTVRYFTVSVVEVLVVLVMTNLLVPDVFVTVKVLAACTVCTANNVINNNNKEIIFFILIALLNLQ